jgi:iron complex outermembrane recepter protein
MLAPVTVTGTRHTQNLFAVPLAITQIGKAQLFGAKGMGLDEALSLVPGVIAQSRYGTGDVRIVIRGFGARGAGDRSNAGTSRGIRVLLDGFPETEPDGRTSFDGIDLAAAHSIEVVRSNSSAVWGNAAGGVVSVSTAPEFERSLLSVDGSAGTFGLKRVTATGGTEVGAGRLAAALVRTSFDGWRDHSNSDRTLLNLSLLTPLGERTQLGVFAMGSSNAFRIPGPLTRAQVDSAPQQANATYQSRDERRFNRLGRLGVNLEHQWSSGTAITAGVFMNPKVLQRSERGTFRDFTRYHIGSNLMFRAPTPLGDRVHGTLTVGADQAYQDGAILFYSLTPQGTRGDTLRDNMREGALNAGVFLQEELEVGEHWTVGLGARYDLITYYSQNFLDPSVDAEKSFRGVSPKLGLAYRLTPRHSVYLALGGGVEVPAGNETDPASTFGQDTVTSLNPLLDPIRSTTFELGTRQAAVFATGPLAGVSYDVALYQTSVRNEIVPYRGGRFYFTAGKARRRGGEVGLTLHGRMGVTVQTALAYQDHRYIDYVVDSVHYGVPGALADYGGNRVVGVPKLTYSMDLSVRPHWADAFRLRAGLQATSSYFADDANTVRVPAYTVANLTLGLDHPIALGSVGLRGFVSINNLFDRRYVASAFLNPDVVGGEPVAFEPGLPRNLVISVGLERRPAAQ